MAKSFDKSGTKFWKSLKDYYDDPEILKKKANEFNDGVTDDFDPGKLNGISRRKFIALLTASAAFTATSCTDYRDKGEIVPYNKRPEEILPGKPNYYASTCKGCELECGILIKTREGRPIKVDGNPEHPVSQGKICAKGQASILNLYDPDRLTEPVKGSMATTWKKADSEIIKLLKSAVDENGEIAIVSKIINSPSTLKAIEEFKTAYPTTKVYFYEYFGDDFKRKAWEKCYGTSALPSVKLNEADVILSLESDFLGREGNYIENARLYAERKDIMKGTDFNKLYVVEGGMSLTGMNADVRIRMKPEYQTEFLLSLINELVAGNHVPGAYRTGEILNTVGGFTLSGFAQKYSVDEKKLTELVKDLVDGKGKSIILAGNTMPEEVHVLSNLLNEMLGNTALYDYSSVHLKNTAPSSNEEMKQLVEKMSNGSVKVLIHFDSNPVYHLPKDLNYEENARKVPAVITLSEAPNETVSVSTYTLPLNNPLESWGDSIVRSNVITLQQPVIAPLFNTREKEAVLLTWASGDPEKYNFDIYHKFVQNNFKNGIYTKNKFAVDFDTFWYSALHDGFVEVNGEQSPPNFNISAVTGISPSVKEGISVHLQPNYYLGDGKFSNNGWLQEIPHPVTKVAWDNFAAMSLATAEKLGVTFNDVVKVSVNGSEVELPVMMQPGMADDLIVVEGGYGRKNSGEVAQDVGFHINTLIVTATASPFVLQAANVSKTGKTYKLVSTQEHNFLVDPSLREFHKIRKIIFEGTLEEYEKDPKFLKEEEKVLKGITREHEYPGLKWGMAIDLNKCISCGICVASCNVENNIPVVGKDQVEVGREMQWMRIDRYYSGEPEDPQVSNQPMLCQHCDNAPCENVCPVNATNHSPDGINQMVYNRCVGTRYCSNNCPYKVRRFNFFDFRDHFADAYYQNDITALAHNPEVTVRSRGVMEKCTFCIQRIMEAREDAIREGRELKGTDVQTACQQACPSNAIIFGDINDPDSEVSKYRNHDIGYHVLEELYVKPNITYMAKLRNTRSEDV